MIMLRAVNETASALRVAGVNQTFGKWCAQSAVSLTALLRKPLPDGTPWHSKFLLASASDAVNAGLTTPEEEAELFARTMSDPLQICQMSVSKRTLSEHHS